MSVSQNFPDVKPELLIDLANVKKLDPRISFSRASVGTYFDENGLLQTAGANEARFDHDPVTEASKGLLRENQATNLVLWSEQFDNAAWGDENFIVTADTVISPDGTLTADLFDEGTDTNIHRMGQNLGLYTSSEYTFSAYAKDVNMRFITLSFTGQNNAYFGATFDLTEETVTATRVAGTNYSYISSSITPVGGGWYKLVVSGVRGNLVSSRFVYISGGTSGTPTVDSRGTESYTGTNRQFYIWGAQLEAGPFPTSYIKTEASQVTRAADVAVLTNTDAYNTTEFTAISQPFGVSSVSAQTAELNGDVPIERLYVYPRNLPQDQINTLVENDGWWSWRIIGSSFALPNFTTDGTVEVDWGDGTVETLTTAEHTFTNASPHTVRFRLTSGTFFRPNVFNNANGTHNFKTVAVGSAPSNMIVDCNGAFFNCSNLKSFDATLISADNLNRAWRGCNSLTSFPLLDMSSAENLNECWDGCSSLTSFPAIDFPVCENFTAAWTGCSSLTSFPLIDTSAGTIFSNTWEGCSSLTSFPLIDTSSGTSFPFAWRECYALTSFPSININNGTLFRFAWEDCRNMTDFPANFFDNWTGVPANNCFVETWGACTSLTPTSVVNILTSLDTSGQSAPASDVDITIDYAGGDISAASTAITNLKSRGWTVTINGVAQ